MDKKKASRKRAASGKLRPKKDASDTVSKADEEKPESVNSENIPVKKSQKRSEKMKSPQEPKQEKASNKSEEEEAAKLPQVKTKKQPKKPNKKEEKKTLTTDAQSDSASLDDFQVESPQTPSTSPNKKIKGKKPNSTSKTASKKAKTPKPPNRSILQLKVVICEITPQIWRRIQVLNNDTFWDLHNHVKEAFGWVSPRSHQFIVPRAKTNVCIVNGALEGIAYDFSEPHLLKEQTTKLSRFLTAKDDKILFEYDMADSWVHEIVVEKILPPPGPKAEYPKCTGGKRACPPEEIGGVDGYNHLMEVYKDPNHPEYEELVTEWLGEYNPGWDPEKFDKKKIFKRVWMWVQA